MVSCLFYLLKTDDVCNWSVEIESFCGVNDEI